MDGTRTAQGNAQILAPCRRPGWTPYLHEIPTEQDQYAGKLVSGSHVQAPLPLLHPALLFLTQPLCGVDLAIHGGEFQLWPPALMTFPPSHMASLQSVRSSFCRQTPFITYHRGLTAVADLRPPLPLQPPSRHDLPRLPAHSALCPMEGQHCVCSGHWQCGELHGIHCGESSRPPHQVHSVLDPFYDPEKEASTSQITC